MSAGHRYRLAVIATSVQKFGGRCEQRARFRRGFVDGDNVGCRSSDSISNGRAYGYGRDGGDHTPFVRT